MVELSIARRPLGRATSARHDLRKQSFIMALRRLQGVLPRLVSQGQQGLFPLQNILTTTNNENVQNNTSAASPMDFLCRGELEYDRSVHSLPC